MNSLFYLHGLLVAVPRCLYYSLPVEYNAYLSDVLYLIDKGRFLSGN